MFPIGGLAHLDRWLIELFSNVYGVFLIGFGVVLVVLAPRLIDIRGYFSRRELSPALETALTRRADLESLSTQPWRVGGSVAIFSGVLVITRILDSAVGYALACAALALALGWTFAHLRNHGVRRAALLSPRRPGSVLSLLWLIFGAGACLTPLVVVWAPVGRVPGTIVTLATLVMFATVIAVRGMPALLSGEDPEREVLIETRLRERRVRGLFLLTLGVPSVFFATVSPGILLNEGAVVLPRLIAGAIPFASLYASAVNGGFLLWVLARINPARPAC